MQSKLTAMQEYFEVTMHVYSGRSDPVWRVEDSNPGFNELDMRLRLLTSTQLPHRLGYRGFTITKKRSDPSGTKSSEIQMQPTSVSCDPDLEKFILSTAKTDDIKAGLKDHALAVINEQEDQEDDFQIIEERNGVQLPKYEPEKWDNPIHLSHNDSYNYCNDIITDTFAIPGRATKHPFPDPPQGKYIMVAAQSDGLKVVAAEDPNNIPEYEWNLVALTFWPPADPEGNWDYHFYRLDYPGRYWSHKPGKTPVTNLDNSGKRISDPRYCNRGPYTEFVCFMQTEKGKVSII